VRDHGDLLHWPVGFERSRVRHRPAHRQRLRGASLLASLRARARAPWLDEELAGGVESWRSPTHAARALQLTSDRHRGLLADWLERLIAEASSQPSALSAKVRPCREQVMSGLPEMLMVAERLRSHTPLDAGAVVRLRRLLADGAGPCYQRIRPTALKEALAEIAESLDLPD